MTRIGHEWMVGGLDVYQEHQASHIVISALLDLIDEADPAPRPEPRSHSVRPLRAILT